MAQTSSCECNVTCTLRSEAGRIEDTQRPSRPGEIPIIPLTEVRRFMTDCLKAGGASQRHAEEHAFSLSEADRRGIFSHGLNRLERYVNEIKAGNWDGKAVPKILKETPASAWVDGCNTFGSVVANFCMDLAIQKCKQTGVGLVCCKRSNHYGIGAIYVLRAVQANVIGFCCTNTSPYMAPTRAKQAALGTNPISCAAPANGGDSFVLDMATTAVTIGKLEISKQKNMPIPAGWALDSNGLPTTDAETALKAALLMPLGGTELNAGFKGFGLACFVELLCGILGGSKFGPFIRKWGSGSSTDAADLGHCFIAIDPEFFAPGFTDRLSTLLEFFRKMEPAEPDKPVNAPGDVEKVVLKKCDAAGGIQYMKSTWDNCQKLAERLQVKPLGR